VRQLGFQAAVFRSAPDPVGLVAEYWTFDAAQLAAAEKLTGRSIEEVQIQPDPDKALQRLLSEGQSVFIPNMAERVSGGLPGIDSTVAQDLVSALGIERAIYAPLRIGGEQVGILMVGGRHLKESDVPTITILTNQVGIAIENTQLLEEQEASQARMQRLALQVVSAQEEERQRISRILHDESGQALTALKISLELIAQELPPELDSTSKRILDAATLTESTMERIRLMAQDLRPPALDTLGLSPTLESFCMEFSSRTQIAIAYHGLALPPLPEPVNISIYRCLQEALTNVARHANADRVQVTLKRYPEGLALFVEDNGQGLDLDAIKTPPGGWPSMGLEIMRERLESLGGTLDIESQPGQGTRLSARMPLAGDK
jgi:signal transduction histidine kinase